MLKLVALALFVAVAAALPVVEDAPESYYWYEFGKFASKYGREYNGINEFHNSYATFKANLQKINAHNSRPSSYKLAVNQFADMTYEQFAKTRLGYKPNGAARLGEAHVVASVAPAAAIDWRTKGLVGPVKDQGQCGSCWAFSTVVSLEGAHARAAGKYLSLSEQQLVDCSTAFGNMGCNGGLMDQAFQYLINATKGDDTETTYPYEGVDGSCRYKLANVGASISSYRDVTAQDESALLDAVSTVGPVSVAIQAADDFMFYDSGVYDSTQCSSAPETLNHGVAVVGYGTENGQNFWIVRNSWGSSWGESGYIRMIRGKNMCGIADCASYPVV